MDQIAQFISLTGTDLDQARFYLDGAGGNLESALNLYYSSGNSGNKLNQPLNSSIPPTSPPQSLTPSQPPKSIPKKTNPPKSKMFTLADLNRGNQDDDDDDDEDKKGTETYAGGTSSGLAIQNPNTNPKKPTPQDISKELFERAKEQGAIDHETYKKQKEASSSSFQGQGHRLGGIPGVPTSVVPGAPKPTEIEISIYIWTDGFSVDDGPLRDFTSRENQLFLSQVQKGEIPLEIRQKLMKDREPGSPQPQVLVNLVKRDTPYAPPPKKFKAFTGEGRSLASSTTTTTTSTTTTFDPYTQLPPNSDNYIFRLDENSPITSIRITLLDGTRLQAKFNLTHTIGDLRRFISRSKPNQPVFDIAISPPLHIFNDDSLTLEQAGLKNAAVIQRNKQ